MFSRLSLTILFVLLLCSSAFAKPAGSWDVVYQLNNPLPQAEDKFSTLGVASHKLMLVYGAEKPAGEQNAAQFIKRSTNGGESWSAVTIDKFCSDTSMFCMNRFTDFQFINENLGFAVGVQMDPMNTTNPNAAGPVWKITDKGRKIDPLIVTDRPTCKKISCVDANSCWVTCDENKVINTTDGGEKWTIKSFPGTDIDNMVGGPIFFLNNKVGWATVYASEPIKDNDGKVTGHKILSKGAIYKTTDGGNKWEALKTGMTYGFWDMQLVNENEGFLSAWNDNTCDLLRTTDGGKNWNPVPIPKEMGTNYKIAKIGGFKFFTTTKGWVAASYGDGDNGTMNVLSFLYTEDAIKYENIPANTPATTTRDIASGLVHSMAFVDEHLAFAVGDNHITLKYDDGSFVPPDPEPDGDSDLPEGTEVGEDGEIIETGPTYKGAPFEPCPVPGKPETLDFPRCDSTLGATVCMWRDGVEPYCSAFLEKDADCYSLDVEAKAKPVNFEGEADVRVCLNTVEDLNNYSTYKYFGYSGAMLGEASPPKCDKNYTGDFAVDEQDGKGGFCSKWCTKDDDCAGGFINEFCCTGVSGDQKYCRYKEKCGATPADGDTSTTDGDIDGSGTDSPTDPNATDGDGSGNPANPEDESGGGCSGTHNPSIIFAFLAVLLIARRRLQIS